MQDYLPRTIFTLTLLAVVSVNFSVAVSSIAMSSAIVLAAVQLFRSGWSARPRTQLDIYFLLYGCAELLATITSVEPVDSFVNMKRLFLILVVYLVLISIDNGGALKGLLVILMLVAGLLSIIEAFSLTAVGGQFLRVSLFQYFMTEGGIKMILLLMLVPLLIHPSTPGSWRLFAGLSAAPILLGLILTQTRSSWLAFIVGVVTIGIIKNRKVILALGALILIFLLIAPPAFRDRAASIFDPAMKSNLTRIHMITTGWEMFLDRPITGWGDIDLKKFYITYTVPIDQAEGGHLHNNSMMLLVTLGLLGFLATSAMFIKIFMVEWEAVRMTTDHWLYGSVTLGSIAAYVGFHVNGLFEWNFGDHEIAVLLWFTVGIALVSRRLSIGSIPR